MDWLGIADGERLPQGVYRLRLVARDVAGNLGPRSGSRTVRIRFLALGRTRVAVGPGERFALTALSQARLLRWRLDGRTGIVRPGTVRFVAPTEPGRYVLRLDANGFVARVAVIVREEAP